MSDSIPIGEEWLSRSIDYLGNIRERLGDLAGYGTLANELIQNAEDARASRIVFDMSDMALTVDNDAKFSDCEQVQSERDCPWKAKNKPSCDWHNLTWIAAGQKRDREETIGKFGVGFLAVYQVTDYPEVMSGRHWELHEDSQDGDKRIKVVCSDGCDRCGPVDGTRFVLPFASDAKSFLRKALGQEATTWREIPALEQAIKEAAPQALLFMNHLREVVIKRDAKLVTHVERIFEQDGPVTTVVISGHGEDQTWFLLDGDFKEQADLLKAEVSEERIERVRHARVRVAVPASGKTTGLLFAGLPTGTATRLPVHIDSSFFPSTDRKRIILEPGNYRTRWNEAALETASQVLADHLLPLRDRLGAVGLWTLILGVSQAKNTERSGDTPDVAPFWSRLAERIRDTQVAWNADEEWTKVVEAPVLRKDEEVASIPALRSLGIVPMSQALQPILGQGLVSNQTGIRWLTLDDVLSGLVDLGLTGTKLRASAPRELASLEGLGQLWTELDLLVALASSMGQLKSEDRMRLLGAAIAPTAGGLLVSLLNVFRADRNTRRLVADLDGIPLLDQTFDDGSWDLLTHCPHVTVETMVMGLERTGAPGIQSRYADGRYDPAALLTWLGGRAGELSDRPELVERIRSLVAFPADRGLAPLDELAMPGDFQDPLGLSDLITMPELHRYRGVLEVLGVHRLTVSEFVRAHVPRAFEDGLPEPDVIRRVMKSLADNARDLDGDDAARSAILELPLIECVDGTFRRPSDVVQGGDIADAVLGPDGPVAVLPADAPRRHQDLWDWLGVPALPTSAQVERRIQQVVAGGSDDDVAAIEAVCQYLNQHRDETGFRALIERLKDVEWLPARDDDESWHRPTELFASFQDYLFETQGTFLAFSRPVQNQLTPLFQLLEIRTSPPTSMVVAHLLACASADKPVNLQVWEALTQGAKDLSVLQLRDRDCVLVGVSYRNPRHVFWNGSTLGGRRVILSPQEQRYRAFFDAIGVRESPTAADAAGVLREIATEVSEDMAAPVDEATATSMRACWALLGEELASGDAEMAEKVLPTLGALPTFLDRVGRACPPTRLYIEDRPQLPGLFSEAVRERIVEFDPASADALRLAGARDFSSVVDVAKLEQGPTEPARSLEVRLQERWHSFRRIMLTSGAEQDPPILLDDFERLAVRQLLIRYELNTEPDHPVTEPERPDAIFIPAERTLYVNESREISWRACARELAVALCGPRNIAKVAPGFLEILRAPSAQDAEDALDELGVTRLSEVVEETSEAEGSAVLGGTDLDEDRSDDRQPPVEDEDDDDVGEDDPAEKSISDGLAAGQGRSPVPPMGRPGPATERGGMRDRAAAAIAAARASTGGRDLDKRKGDASRSSGQRSAPEAVLRSYLPAPGDREIEHDPESAARRTETDRAGVARAIRYEEESGREPTEMPHGNPGFDIVSRRDGQIARHIEVKSLSGSWRDASPGLSAPQHQLAMELGDGYWLYVVENAGGPSEELHTIQNPIGRATLFGFDPGWVAVAWDDDAPFEDLDDEGADV